MLDYHLHLARLPHPEQLAQTLWERGMSFVAIACEPWEWEIIDKIDLHESGAKAFGIHPMIAGKVTEDDWRRLGELLEKNSNAAVGECGIDKRYEGYGDFQENVFRRQAELARDLNRDLQIHCVGDYGRIVKILKEVGYPRKVLREKATQDSSAVHAVFHRFGGDASIVRATQELHPIFSLHPDSFHKKSTAAAIAKIPAEQVRFETDADETFLKDEGTDKTATEIADRLMAQLQAVKVSYDSKI